MIQGASVMSCQLCTPSYTQNVYEMNEGISHTSTAPLLDRSLSYRALTSLSTDLNHKMSLI